MNEKINEALFKHLKHSASTIPNIIVFVIVIEKEWNSLNKLFSTIAYILISIPLYSPIHLIYQLITSI